MPRYSFSEKQVLEAIADSGGVINTIRARLAIVAKRATLNWHTAKYWIEQWESTKQAFEGEMEILLDKCETILQDALDSETEHIKVNAAKYTLSTKGKSRGWTHKQEFEGRFEGQVEQKITNLPQWENLTPEQAYTILHGHKPPEPFNFEDDDNG